MKRMRQGASWHGNDSAGFTLIELFAIVATIAVLAAMLVPALSRSKVETQEIRCITNQKQLATAWIMYYEEDHGNLPLNGDEGYQPTSPNPLQDPQWCPGRMDVAGTGNQPTNVLWIEAGGLYPYLKNVAVYRCPADQSTFSTAGGVVHPRGGTGDPRVRSVSMNAWMNPELGFTLPAGFYVYNKDSDLRHPGPASLYVFIDESPYSIQDGMFIEEPTSAGNPPTGNSWTDGPASHHNGGAGISFADGHAQIKQWSDPTILSWTRAPGNYAPQPSHGPDLNWLLSKTTAHK